MSSNLYVCPKCGKTIEYGNDVDLFEVAMKHLPTCSPTAKAPAHQRITDVVPQDALQGNLVNMDDILDQEVLITDMSWHDSTYKEDDVYLSLTLVIEGEEKVLNTGAARVVQAFRAVPQEALPIYAAFERIQLPNGRRVYHVK